MSVELVEVVRSGFRECVHRGSLVVLAPDGDPVVDLGETHTPIYPRSTNKPLQSVALLRNGFEPVDDAELAIATASHEGESQHLELVRRLLDRHGLREDQLQCPAALPANDLARAAALTSGGARERKIYMNCSGKHAAMLATCAINGWPLDSYLEPAHPLQRAVVDTIADLTGEPEADLGIDGCGLPIVPVSLTNLARTFSAFTTAAAGTPQLRVADAVRRNPFTVSGTGMEDLLLMNAVPGLLCKAGADGVMSGALADGSAFAFKIDDGHDRARLPLAAAVLHRMGVEWDDDQVQFASQPVFGGAARVGVIRALSGLF